MGEVDGEPKTPWSSSVLDLSRRALPISRASTRRRTCAHPILHLPSSMVMAARGQGWAGGRRRRRVGAGRRRAAARGSREAAGGGAWEEGAAGSSAWEEGAAADGTWEQGAAADGALE